MAVPLTEGKTYSVDTLMHLIMIPSASASCIAMAEHISGSEAAFVERMNQTADALGLNATYYNCRAQWPPRDLSCHEVHQRCVALCGFPPAA